MVVDVRVPGSIQMLDPGHLSRVTLGKCLELPGHFQQNSKMGIIIIIPTPQSGDQVISPRLEKELLETLVSVQSPSLLGHSWRDADTPLQAHLCRHTQSDGAAHVSPTNTPWKVPQESHKLLSYLPLTS